MATWASVATDDCSGTNGDSFDGRSVTGGTGTWENVLGGGCEVAANKVEGITGGSLLNAARMTDASTKGNNQRVYIGSTNNLLIGPMARVQADGTGYFVGAASKFGAWTLYDVQNSTTLSSLGSGSDRSSQTVELRIEGTSWAVYLNGASDFSGTDSTYSTGNPGVGCWSNNINADDWEYFEDTDEGGGGVEGTGETVILEFVATLGTGIVGAIAASGLTSILEFVAQTGAGVVGDVTGTGTSPVLEFVPQEGTGDIGGQVGTGTHAVLEFVPQDGAGVVGAVVGVGTTPVVELVPADGNGSVGTVTGTGATTIVEWVPQIGTGTVGAVTGTGTSAVLEFVVVEGTGETSAEITGTGTTAIVEFVPQSGAGSVGAVVGAGAAASIEFVPTVGAGIVGDVEGTGVSVVLEFVAVTGTGVSAEIYVFSGWTADVSVGVLPYDVPMAPARVDVPIATPRHEVVPYA